MSPGLSHEFGLDHESQWFDCAPVIGMTTRAARHDSHRPRTAALPLMGAGLCPAYQTLPESPGLVMAPSLAEATLRTYLAKTPVV